MKKAYLLTCTLLLAAPFISYSQNTPANISKVWVPDNGNGTYTNPIIHADYSDPDAIRVGDDYYLVSSSFNNVPGLPILHSKDLVNWTIIGHVFTRQPPFARYDTVQHGGGVWAPAIRYHNGEFYLYYPDPDIGIYLVKAKNAAGPWTEPLLIKNAIGWIDPCPFWDDNGNAYLINGLAGSRSSMKSLLIINRMSADGTKLLDDGVLVFDGHGKHPTIEGPKLYKRNGYYYILAPAGGVGNGWQLALRSKNIYGPYEEKIVLEQGSSATNGPHQGGLVDTKTGESWFLHFQDKDAYGRIVHLQPVKWVADWPMMGIDNDGNGIGEPVITYKKPNVGSPSVGGVTSDSISRWTKSKVKSKKSKKEPVLNPFENEVRRGLQTPQESDEFNGNSLGRQWQWAANPKSNWAFPAGGAYGVLRLFNVPAPDNLKNGWNIPNILTQKFPAPTFTAVTKFTLTARTAEEEAGLIITGIDYAYITLKKGAKGFVIYQSICKDAEGGKPEKRSDEISLADSTVYFKVEVKNMAPTDPDYKTMNTASASQWGNAACTFSYSTDGSNFTKIGDVFAARKGKWIGAQVGIFATRKGRTYEMGNADFDWFRITK